MQLLFLLSLIQFVSSNSDIPSKSSPFQHIPFTHKDQITPNTVFQRYPQQKPLLRPEILSYRLVSLPWPVRNVEKYFSITVVDRSVRSKCHTDQCPWNNRFPGLIQRYVNDHQDIKSMYILFTLRDQVHIKLVRQWLENNRVKEPEFSQMLNRIQQIISSTPTWMMSINLQNPLERQRILIPDAWMLFKDWNGVKRQAQEGSRQFPWDRKESKIFWRGADSGVSFEYVDVWSDISKYFQRLQIIRYSRDHPEIVDARFTGVLHGEDFSTKLEDLGLNLRSGEVAVRDHMKYKYLISIDGWTAAWFRPQWIMASNSVFLKQQSEKVQWFYHRLIPYKHYYPIANDLSDLLQAYKYLEQHQQEAQSITRQANRFASENFELHQVEAAFYGVLEQYLAHQKMQSVFEPVIRPGYSFEYIHEQFSDNDRNIIFPPIGKTHQCKTPVPTPEIIPHSLPPSKTPAVVIIPLTLFYLIIRLGFSCKTKYYKRFQYQRENTQQKDDSESDDL